MSVTSPALGVEIFQVLVPSAWNIVSVPVPPAMSPVSVPPLAILKVSVPVPPVTFSTPLKVPMSVTSPALGVEISQVLAPSAWVIVSSPVPPMMSPVSVAPLAMLKVSLFVPPSRSKAMPTADMLKTSVLVPPWSAANPEKLRVSKLSS